MVLKNIVVPIFQEIEELSKNQWLRGKSLQSGICVEFSQFSLEELRVRRAENPGLPGLLSVLVKLGWDQIVRVNPSLTTLLEILFKSMIIKGVFHSLATLMQLSIKVEPLTSVTHKKLSFLTNYNFFLVGAFYRRYISWQHKFYWYRNFEYECFRTR